MIRFMQLLLGELRLPKSSFGVPSAAQDERNKLHVPRKPVHAGPKHSEALPNNCPMRHCHGSIRFHGAYSLDDGGRHFLNAQPFLPDADAASGAKPSPRETLRTENL
jgi:hypothetical protein